MTSFLKKLRNSFLNALWMMLLTFPIMVIKVDLKEFSVTWRWMNLLWIGIGTFVISWIWSYFISRRDKISKLNSGRGRRIVDFLWSKKETRAGVLTITLLFVIGFPWIVNLYQVGIITSALMFVVLGLGLNIVIGYGGLLHLGYAAFYAMGAYNYALMYLYWGIQFWIALPLGAISGALFGILIGFPVLRLRGDYLAIVTLALGEIVRLLLLNLSDFTKGAEGIAQIPRPAFVNELSLRGATNYLFYICVVLLVFTIFVVRRLEDSRIGRALEAMRDDEIAAQSMGIDLTKNKLITFALGAIWAGIVGVILAAKTTYVNPGSFTLMESVMILVAVVLGGMGSIPGVMLGALIVVLIPEYFRALSDYRMLMFGVVLVFMPIFRPRGIIPRLRKHYIVGEAESKSSS